MDKKAIIERLETYFTPVRKNFDVEMFILYGSYARGMARIDSDIDVAVVVDSIQDDLLASEAQLFRLRRALDERIHPVLLESRNDRSGFLAEIVKNGDILFQKT
jgi:predicted nucleotidyltransferase